jgi:hypothetical protein
MIFTYAESGGVIASTCPLKLVARPRNTRLTIRHI